MSRMFLVVTCYSEERHTQWSLVFNIYISITVTDKKKSKSCLGVQLSGSGKNRRLTQYKYKTYTIMTLPMHLSMCFSEVYVTFMFGRQVRLDVDALEYVDTSNRRLRI